MCAWGTLTSRITTRMLGWLNAADVKQAVVDVLARAGGADAFTILEEVGLRLGRGPFLTPTKLEATLLTLESTGTVVADRDDGRTWFSLATLEPAA